MSAPRPGRGGARAGAGRKPKAAVIAAKATSIESLMASIEDLGELIPVSLRDLIQGVYVEERTSTGKRNVYQRAPDINAIKEVLNRSLGKVTEKVEHSGAVSLELIDDIRRRAGR